MKANKRSKIEVKLEEALSTIEKLKAENNELTKAIVVLRSDLNEEVELNCKNANYIFELESKIEELKPTQNSQSL